MSSPTMPARSTMLSNVEIAFLRQVVVPEALLGWTRPETARRLRIGTASLRLLTDCVTASLAGPEALRWVLEDEIA
jgi:hypothetical protein